jgi:hypothetical protein
LGVFRWEQGWIPSVSGVVILPSSCKPHKVEGINVIFNLIME